MIEEVYNYLREFGFTKDEVNFFEDSNEKMFFTNINEVKKNISFLNNKNLTKEEIIQVFKKNPFMITVKDSRLNALDKIYLEELKFESNLLKELIVNNPETYTISPIELQKIIDYLKEHNYSIEVIRDFILKNPKIISIDAIMKIRVNKIISMEFNEFIKLLKVN